MQVKEAEEGQERISEGIEVWEMNGMWNREQQEWEGREIKEGIEERKNKGGRKNCKEEGSVEEGKEGESEEI